MTASVESLDISTT
jgi:hypothetical protein